MTGENYQLGETVSKTTENITLWKSEKGILEIAANALAVQIGLDKQPRGYVFRGEGRLLLDTIVETKRGAVGKPVDRNIKQAFLMLGNISEIERCLVPADTGDFERLGFEKGDAFISEAEDLLAQFLKQKTRGAMRLVQRQGTVFAFQNEKDALDILAAEGPTIVYKASDKVFVSNRNNVVLKKPTEVVVSSNGKSFVIGKSCFCGCRSNTRDPTHAAAVALIVGSKAQNSVDLCC